MPGACRQEASVMDPQSEALAEVYAQGLLDCLPADDQAEQAAEQLEGVVGLLESVEGFGRLLTAGTLSLQERLGVIQRVFGGRILLALESLLGLLNRRDRLFLLPQVSASFRRLLDRREGKVEVFVTSAAPLDARQRAGVASLVAEELGAEAVLHLRVDPSLVGGLRLRIGDRSYDATLAGRLAALRRGIAGGRGEGLSPRTRPGASGAADGRREDTA